MQTKTSIIVPVYNAIATLRRCVDSLLAQTLQDSEIILVDDGSTDGSTEIVTAYEVAHPKKIKAIYKENGGVSAARNAALKIAQGRYIGFVDSDDYAAPEMFDQLYQAADAAQAQLAFCRRYSLKPAGAEEKQLPDFFAGRTIFEATDMMETGALLRHISVFIWDKLFDAEIIRREKLMFSEVYVYAEDFCFLAEYLYHVRRAAIVDLPLYYYNAFSAGSVTNSIGYKWYHIYGNLQRILDYYNEKGIYSVIRDDLCDVCMLYYDRRANMLFFHGQKLFQLKYVRYSMNFLDSRFPEWRLKMRRRKGVLFPAVKTRFALMVCYILTPNFIKRRLGRKIGGV
jgi:glycosyltransferase involved in cell wall biosynthesis